MKLVRSLVALSLVPLAAHADVLTVGAGQSFADLQPAVDAAAEGDVLLVSGGSYSAPVIAHKGLAITADAGGSVVVTGTTSILATPAGSAVVLQGLQLLGPIVFTDTAAARGLLVEGCAGAVRVERCTVRGGRSARGSGGAARVTACGDVAFVGCTLDVLAAPPVAPPFLIPSPAEPGLYAAGSSVALHGCAATGGSGHGGFELGLTPNGEPGAPGALLVDSLVFASGCTATGGQGGRGLASAFGFPGGNGGAGGAGVTVVGSTTLAHLSTVFTGGAGGLGGQGSFTGPAGFNGSPGPAVASQGGALVPLAGSARGMTVPSPFREDETVTATFTGTPGEVVALVFNTQAVFAYDAAISGALLVLIEPNMVQVLGVVPGSGSLDVAFELGDLGPGLEAFAFLLQPVFLGGLAVAVGAPATAIALDAAL